MVPHTVYFSKIAVLSMIAEVFLTTTVIMLCSDHIKSNTLRMVITFILLLAIFFPLKLLVPIHHYRGAKLSKRKEYLGAIDEFEQSYQFFTKYKLVDDLRFITTLSPNDISYRELALCSIAYNYSLFGDREKSKGYYIKALQEFPKSEIAKDNLVKLDLNSDLIKLEN